jgi:hypothetical protein
VWHEVQLLNPAAEYVFAGQLWHTVLPEVLENVPLSQLIHAVEFGAYAPAEHTWQTLAPADCTKEPDGHEAQDDAPDTLEKEPVEHNEHELRPATENVPGEHG